MAMSRRRALVGAAVAALYVVACVATSMSGRVRVRPLFEGFAPPPPYRWVAPPKRFAANNVKPSTATGQLAVQSGKSAAGAVATDDGQFVANFAAGAVAVTPDAGGIDLKATPVDPATLGPLPAGTFADGNAYRLDVTARPAGTPVASLATPGNVIVSLPSAGTGVAFSADGRTWQQVTSQPVGGSKMILGVSFDKPGFFIGLASTDINGTASSGGGGSSAATIAVIALVAFAAVIVGGGGLAWWRRRAASPPPARRSPPSRPGRSGTARRPGSSSNRNRNASSNKNRKKRRR